MRQRDLRFTFSILSSTTEFEVIEFTLEEALCETFRLTVELACHRHRLDFEQLLDRPALLTLWQGSSAVRHVHGLVSSVTQGASGIVRTRYRMLIEPQLARLRLSSDWRVHQDRSVPEIIKRSLAEHGILHYQPNLHTEYAPREYCVQAGDSDYHFLERLAREEGLVSWYTFDERTHLLHHSDKLYVQPRIPGGPVTFNAQPTGDNPQPVIRSFNYTQSVRTARQTQRDYTFKRPGSDLQRVASGDQTQQGMQYERYDYPGRYKAGNVGQPFTRDRLQGHRRDARVARLEGDDPRLLPGHSFQLQGHPREDFNTWWRPVRIVHRGVQYTSQEDEASHAEQGVSYDYTAEVVAEELEWRAEPLPKPRIDGPQVATVVGPEHEEIFTDEWSRVKIQFPWDRRGDNDEFSSCWVRVAQQWAGTQWGHMAIPRIGQEVIVSYLDGDCDQPLIIGRTYRATNPVPYALPAHKTLSTLKSKEHRGSRANELRIDDTTEQISAALMSDHGASHLHLGYLTHPRPEGGAPRGEGFELRTDEHGALRAAKGLLLSTEAQLHANGGQLNRSTVVEVLEAALQLAKGLGDYAGVHQGIRHDAAPQRTLSEAVAHLGQGANDESGSGPGGEPAITLSGPAGIAAGTPQSITLAAGEHIDSVAQQHQQLTAGQRLVLNAGSDLGLFAQSGDMHHIAHQGQLLMQAQHNDIHLQADQSVEVSASQQHVLISAKEHITLRCAGAYLTLKGGNIELGMPGNFIVKAAKHSHVGPASASTTFNTWDSAPFDDIYLLRDENTLEPLAKRKVELRRGDGSVQILTTDATGRLPRQQDLSLDQVQIRVLPKGGHANDDKEPNT